MECLESFLSIFGHPSFQCIVCTPATFFVVIRTLYCFFILIVILTGGISIDIDTSDFYGVRMDHAKDIPLPNRARSRSEVQLERYRPIADGSS